MGIDPGFAITGYGIIKYEGNRFAVEEYGAVITETSDAFSERLRILNNKIKELIRIYNPDAFAIEELFSIKILKLP